jgi:23S rRNA (uracil-5-)-methyltransferase RumA
MESFFQPNPLAAEKLYEKVAEYVFRNKTYAPDQVIMDLFCGTGTIGQVLASRTQGCQIIGVDIVQEAIDHATANAALNHIAKAEFVAADVGKFLSQRPELAGKIETIVLDPPRAGVVKDTLEKVIALGASRIVYVSCNPSTQARDFLILKDAGYHVQAISLVDQFPHTGHIEAVALLERECEREEPSK